jgi:hypothetical protein
MPRILAHIHNVHRTRKWLEQPRRPSVITHGDRLHNCFSADLRTDATDVRDVRQSAVVLVRAEAAGRPSMTASIQILGNRSNRSLFPESRAAFYLFNASTCAS